MGATNSQGFEGAVPKALRADTVWLARFGDKDWRHHLHKWAQDNKFEKTLKPRLDREEQQWHATQRAESEPVIVHHAIDDTLQTSNSRLLGGAMSIHAPWTDDAKQNPPS